MRFARRIVSALIMTIAAAGASRVKVGEELRRATAGGAGSHSSHDGGAG